MGLNIFKLIHKNHAIYTVFMSNKPYYMHNGRILFNFYAHDSIGTAISLDK